MIARCFIETVLKMRKLAGTELLHETCCDLFTSVVFALEKNHFNWKRWPFATLLLQPLKGGTWAYSHTLSKSQQPCPAYTVLCIHFTPFLKIYIIVSVSLQVKQCSFQEKRQWIYLQQDPAYRDAICMETATLLPGIACHLEQDSSYRMFQVLNS